MAEKKKVPLRRVYANDLEVELDGEKFYPHAGEYVEIRPFWTIDERQLHDDFLSGKAAGDAGTLQRTWDFLVARVVAWDWTDDLGEPMPQPSEAVLRRLANYEVFWLQKAVKGMAGTAEKDDEPGNVAGSASTGTSVESLSLLPAPIPSPGSARSSVAPLAKRASKGRGK